MQAEAIEGKRSQATLNLDVHPQTRMLSRLERLVNCDHSRLATNFEAFLSQLARMYKVYLAAFSHPRLWGNGLPLSQHHNVVSQCSNSVEGLKQCTVFQQLHEGYDRDFGFVFLLLEALWEMMTPEGVKGGILFQCDQVILSAILWLQVWIAKYHPYSHVGL